MCIQLLVLVVAFLHVKWTQTVFCWFQWANISNYTIFNYTDQHYLDNYLCDLTSVMRFTVIMSKILFVCLFFENFFFQKSRLRRTSSLPLPSELARLRFAFVNTFLKYIIFQMLKCLVIKIIQRYQFIKKIKTSKWCYVKLNLTTANHSFTHSRYLTSEIEVKNWAISLFHFN